MSVRYEILEDNTVEVFYDDADAPSLRQPNYPGGDPFDTREEAENWAILYVESVTNPDAPYAPANKGLVGDPKPTPEQVASLELARKSGIDLSVASTLTPDQISAIADIINQPK
jgi:hypothetical protein